MAKTDAINGLALNGRNAVSATWRSVPAEMATGHSAGGVVPTAGWKTRMFSEKTAVVVTETRKDILSQDWKKTMTDSVNSAEPAPQGAGDVVSAGDYQNITG